MNEVQTYLRTELNDEVKLQLKLENPLGVAERIFDKYLTIVHERKQILVDDEQVDREQSTILGEISFLICF